jgi:hypothetical protein
MRFGRVTAIERVADDPYGYNGVKIVVRGAVEKWDDVVDLLQPGRLLFPDRIIVIDHTRGVT